MQVRSDRNYPGSLPPSGSLGNISVLHYLQKPISVSVSSLQSGQLQTMCLLMDAMCTPTCQFPLPVLRAVAGGSLVPPALSAAPLSARVETQLATLHPQPLFPALKLCGASRSQASVSPERWQ